VAGEDGRRLKGEVVVEAEAKVPEDRVEHPAHGEHGRSGVDPRPVHLQLPHLAPGRGGALRHRDGEAAPGEFQGRHEAGHPRSDHHHPSIPHGNAFLATRLAGTAQTCAIRVDLRSTCVNLI
jgi:hypothetical protein